MRASSLWRRLFLCAAVLFSAEGAFAQTADLSASLSDTPDPMTLGTGTVTYTAGLFNGGASAATNATITFNAPAGSTIDSATPNLSGSCNTVGQTVTCTWSSVPVSNSRSASIVTTPTTGGTLTATASVSAVETDPNSANNNASTSTTVNASIDLQIYSISDSPDPITLGTGNITYSTTIYNASSSKATNPVLTLTPPAASTFVSATPNLSGTCSGTGPVTCSWAGDLTSGSTRTVTLVVTPTAGGTATLTASVDGDQPDNVPGNDTGTHSTTVNANIDLQIYSISDSPDPITLGTGNITYSTTIYNSSSSKGTNPVLTLTLPAASTFVSATASNSGTCSGTGPVTCSWAGDFGSGSTRTVSLVVTPTAGGTATLTATVDGDQPDATPANDTASHSTTVNANIDLQVYSMFDSPDPITLGTGNITYTTTIYNASSSKATNPVLTLTIPAASTFVSATATNSGICSGTTTVTCSWAGDLTAGNTRNVSLVVTPTAGGTATLTATVDGDQPDNVPGNDTASHSTTVNEFIDLQVYSMFDTPDPITLGTGNITYTTTIYNASSSKATNPILTLTLPAASTFVSATASNSGTCSGTTTVICSWAGDLTAGNTRNVSLVVTPTAGGTATLTASVDGDQPDNVNGNDTANHSTTVNEFIDLQVYSMFDTPDPITLGTGNITYTTTIYNASSSKATNPVLTLTLPAASTFVSATASNSGTCTGTTTVTCSWAGDLTAGNTRTVTLIVTPTAGGTATLTASVDGDQPDNVNGNDTANHSTTVNEFIDLQVYSMFDTPDPITLGTGNITYTTTIYNASSSKATNAVLTLAIPAASTFVSATASNSGTCSGTTTVTCSWAGDLTAGNTRNVTLLVTPTAGGTATLTASVDGDQPDNVNGNDTANHSTTVNEFIDLQIYSISDSPDPITLGTGNITYTTTIYNASSSKATNPVLTLTIPAASTFVSATASNSGTCSGTTTVICSWSGDLTAGNTRNVSLIVTPTAGGTLTLNAAVDGDQPDNVNGNDTGSQNTTVNASIELSVTLSDSPDPRVIGAGNVTYSSFITNSSSSKATTPKITFTIPSTTTYVSHTATSATCTVGATTVECTWTDVNGGSSRSATFVVSPSQVGQLTATATVTSDQPDPNSGNNTATATTNVNPGTAPSISSFSPTSGPAGTTVTISGSSFFSSTFVKFNGVSSTFVVNNNGSITATVPGGATTGTIAITNANGTGTSTGQFTVTPAPDLSIAKTASAGTTPTSSPFSYTLTVSNTGAGSAADVTVTDTLPAGVTLTSVSGTNWTCSGTTTITCTHGALAASTTAPPIVINVIAPASGTTVTNTATVDSTTPDNNAANDSSTVSVGVVGCPTTPAITAPATVCAGSTGHVATTPSVPGGTYAWSITNGTITSATTGETITFDAGSTDPVTLTVAVFVTSCPTAMNSVNVNVSTPTASITPSGSTTFCAGGSVTLTANSGASYLWSTSETTQSITVTASGNYDVAVTDAAGCTVTSTPTTVTVNPIPSATITPSGATTFCDGGSVTLNAPAGMASYLWSTGETSPSIVADATGSYFVTVTSAAGCSNTSAPVSVTETPAPSAVITPSGSTTFCAGDSVTLTASNGASWLWSNGQTTQSIAVNTAGDYFVTVTDGGGCSATSATTTVTVNPLPTPAITGPASACGSATLDASGGYVSYVWGHGPTTQTVSVTTGGTYSVTVTDANGCSATTSHNIAITSPPPVSIQGPAAVCSTDLPVTLDAGSGYVSYAWSTTETSQTISVSAAGTYSVTVTDANGCTATASHVLTVNTTPTATITPGGPTTFCDGGSVTLTASAAQSYAWSNGETTQSIVVYAGGTFTVTTTDNACSATSAPVTVTVNPPASVTISGPATACSSTPAVLDAGTGFVSYNWSTGETSQTISVSATGTYSVTVTDANGCTATDSHDVNVTTTPANTVATSGSTSFCDGGSVTLTASPAASYAWSNGETTQSIVVTASGTFTVTTSNGSCSATSSPVLVTEHPPTTVAITGPSTACDSAMLDAGSGFVSYNWSTGDTGQSITVTTSGTYSVTVTDANGCTASASHAITITGTPAASISHSGPLTFCDGGSVTLTSTPAASYAWSNGETTQSIVVSSSGTFTVTTTDGTCSSTSPPIVVTEHSPVTAVITGPSTACDSALLDAGPGFVSYNWSTGDTGQSITVTTSGTYSVTVTDANGCTASASHNITITATPANTVATSGPTSFCDGGSVTLTASPAASYAWSNGETTQSIVVSSSGTFTVTTSNGACSATSSPVVVTEHPPTIAAISGPSTACDSAILDAGPGFVSYNWSTGDTGQSITVTTSGTYSVTVTDANGCTASASHAITITTTPAASISHSGPLTFCDGGSVTLTSSPAASYAWSNGETTQSIVASSSGTFTVTTTDGTCSSTSPPITVTVHPPVTAVITGPSTACDSALLDAGPGFVSYNWSTGETTQTVNVTADGTYSVTVTDGNGCSATDSHVISVNPAPVIGITGPANACASAALSASAGFVSYNWSTGETTQAITVTTGGTYTVTGTDANGCSASASHTIVITPGTAPAITASGPTTFCDGGSVTLTSSPAASYAWSNGATTQSITVTASGTFTVTTNDGVCTATSAPVTVTEHPPTAVNITGNVNACGEGTLDAGPGFASYFWSTGETTQVITVGNAASYTVTVTDANGCTGSDSFTVTVPPQPAPGITAFGPLTFCEGGSVKLSASGGTNHLWSTGETTPFIIVTTSGTYGVTWTDSCGHTASPEPKTVTVKPAPSAAITAPTTATEGATNLAASVAAQAGASYAWSISNGTITSGAGTHAVTFTAGGAGTATLTAVVTLDGCSATGTHNVTVTGQTVSQADVSLTKSAPPSVLAGASFQYTLVASNHGPSNATSVVVSDTLPSGVTLTSVHGGAFQCSTLPAGVFCNGALAVNAANTITLTVTAPQQAGTIANTATIDAGLTDPEPGNNSATATTSVTLDDNCGPNAAPQLNAPVPGSTLGSPVTFAWSPVPGAIGYRVWIEVNGTAPQDLGTTDGAISFAANVPPGSIVAYVDALFAACTPTRSPSIAFTVIPSDPCVHRATPTLVAPANNATLASSTVNLQWTAANGATGYRIWAIIDGAAAAVLGTTTDATSLQVVIPHGSVEWWAEALYQGCASTESAHSHFTIPQRNDCSPQTPEAQSPSGITVTTSEVTFQWTPVPGAVSYEVWLAIDNGTPTLIGTTTATSLTGTVTPGVLDWFVRAIVSGCPSRDSETRRFTYTPPANCGNAQRPNAVSPFPDAHVTSPVDFAWTPSPGATLYELFEVHGNDEELLAQTTNTFANGVALPNGNARWFVRAHFGAGCSPLDSAEQQLVVVPTPAACAALLPPRVSMVSQISSALPVVMQWNEIPGATSYQLQIASNASFANAEEISTDKTLHTLTRENDGTTPIAVYARVRAIDARCTPEATVTPYGPSAVVFILPATGNEMSAPLTGGIITQQLLLGPELAGQSFVATANQPWLSVFPQTGVVASEGTSLSVSAIANGLPIGTSLGAIHIELTPPSFGSVRANASSRTTTTISIGKVTPVMPTPKTAPPPDALIIPAVAHADGINSRFQSDVRVTNSSAQLLNYQVSFTPTGGAGITAGKQTQFSIEPGRTIALDDVLKSWFGTGGESVTGTLEVRPLTKTTSASSSSSNALSGLPKLVTFASSRTFNVTSNGTFGQYIPAIPFANFIGKATDLAKPAVLSLQQIAQSSRYRTNLGIVEGSGEAVNLMVKVFGNNGAKLSEFPVNLAGGQHTQLNSFLVAQGVGPVTDGRIEVSVVGGSGKVTAYASVLDNDTSDPLLVTPVTLTDAGTTRWVMPGVADLDNGTANWQTDMRVFNAGTTDVETTLTFYSQNGGTPKTANVTIPAGQVKQFDRTLASVFGASNDGGAVHITTPNSARLIATARTYNQTTTGTYGQFISAVTPNEAAAVGTRPLQLLQVEESDRFRSNIGLAEVTGNPVKLELSIVPPDAKFTIVTELTLQANEFRQLNSLLRSAGLGETYNARVTVRAIEGNGRVTAYASVIDMLTNDPTYVPAQ